MSFRGIRPPNSPYLYRGPFFRKSHWLFQKIWAQGRKTGSGQPVVCFRPAQVKDKAQEMTYFVCRAGREPSCER